MNKPDARSAGITTTGNAMLPRLTLLTPVTGTADRLAEAITSVIDQNYEQLEYLVISADRIELPPELLQGHADRIQVIQSAGAGRAELVNRGFALAHGELFGLVDVGDPVLPGALRALARALGREPEVVAAYPDGIMGDEHGALAHDRVIDYGYVDQVRWHDSVPISGSLMRREIFEKAGGFDPSFRGDPDYEFFLRAGLLGTFRRVPLALDPRYQRNAAPAAVPNDERARDQVRAIEKLYARDDLPEAVCAVRGEAFRNAYVAAAILFDPGGRSDERFVITDYLQELHFDLERRRLPASLSPAEVIEELKKALVEQDRGIEWLRGVIADREKKLEWLEYEAAEREKMLAVLKDTVAEHNRAIEWLRGLASERDKAIEWLHHEAAERDRTIAWLQETIAEREKLADSLRAELGRRGQSAGPRPVDGAPSPDRAGEG